MKYSNQALGTLFHVCSEAQKNPSNDWLAKLNRFNRQNIWDYLSGSTHGLYNNYLKKYFGQYIY
jgi:hypothetical protein